MHWARMFSSGSRSPVCLSTPVSIRPSRSVVSPARPASRRRSAMIWSTRSFMNAWSSCIWRCARMFRRAWIGSCRARFCESARLRVIASTNGCWRVAVEGVEPVAETAEGDGVERQPGHVGRDVDLLARVQPRPLVHQLVGDVEHVGHVVAHRLQAERRHEDVVRAVPQRVVGVGGEQPVARTALAEVPPGRPRPTCRTGCRRRPRRRVPVPRGTPGRRSGSAS